MRRLFGKPKQQPTGAGVARAVLGVCESQYRAICNAAVALESIDGRRLDVVDKELLAEAQSQLASTMSGSLQVLREVAEVAS